MKKFLFKVARSKYASYFIGQAFAHLTAFMPLDRQYEDDKVILFMHPVPFWPMHILAVPKKRLPSFTALQFSENGDRELILSLLRGMQLVARQKELVDYTVLVNGGAYQDVPQLHFHLASGPSYMGQELGVEALAYHSVPANAWRLNHTLAYQHPNPIREFYYIITSESAMTSLDKFDFDNQTQMADLLDMLTQAQKCVAQYALTEYTLIIHVLEPSLNSALIFHLVSGKSLQ